MSNLQLRCCRPLALAAAAPRPKEHSGRVGPRLRTYSVATARGLDHSSEVVGVSRAMSLPGPRVCAVLGLRSAIYGCR